MTTTKNLAMAVLVGLVAVACAKPTPPNRLDADKYTQVVEADFDETWRAVVDAASEQLFAVKNFEKDSGLLTFEFSGIAGDYVDCGTLRDAPALVAMRNTQKGPMFVSKPSLRVTGIANVSVRPVDTGTRMRVNTRMSMTWLDYSSVMQTVGFGTTEVGRVGHFTCTSNGRVEAKLLRSVKSRLR